jgi:hypothetical protein
LVVARCFRYSVPHRLVREHVEVQVAEQQVRVFRGAELVATHRRSVEPHSRVEEPSHRDGLWRREPIEIPDSSPLAAMGRTLEVYAAAIEEEAA